MSAEPHRHMQRINDALGVVFRKNGFEAVDYSDPEKVMIARERAQGLDVEDLVDPGATAEESAIREEVFNLLFDFIFRDGPHPGVVMRRLYATAWAFRRDLIGEMSQRDLAKMFEETPAAMNWRINRMFTDYLKAAGMRGRIAGQKSLGAIEKYSRSAQGNQNRKGGRKHKK